MDALLAIVFLGSEYCDGQSREDGGLITVGKARRKNLWVSILNAHP